MTEISKDRNTGCSQVPGAFESISNAVEVVALRSSAMHHRMRIMFIDLRGRHEAYPTCLEIGSCHQLRVGGEPLEIFKWTCSSIRS